jgi:hypothetical protein
MFISKNPCACDVSLSTVLTGLFLQAREATMAMMMTMMIPRAPWAQLAPFTRDDHPGREA